MNVKADATPEYKAGNTSDECCHSFPLPKCVRSFATNQLGVRMTINTSHVTECFPSTVDETKKYQKEILGVDAQKHSYVAGILKFQLAFVILSRQVLH